MAEKVSSATDLPARQWWEARRLRFNIGLVIAGLLAFVLYLVVYFSFSRRIPMEIDVTIFTIFFQGIGFLFYMAAANAFYFLGALSENLPLMINLQTYRKIAYALGFLLAF